jgi:hypothetical protein
MGAMMKEIKGIARVKLTEAVHAVDSVAGSC